jgi:hypothetical protein
MHHLKALHDPHQFWSFSRVFKVNFNLSVYDDLSLQVPSDLAAHNLY